MCLRRAACLRGAPAWTLPGTPAQAPCTRPGPGRLSATRHGPHPRTPTCATARLVSQPLKIGHTWPRLLRGSSPGLPMNPLASGVCRWSQPLHRMLRLFSNWRSQDNSLMSCSFSQTRNWLQSKAFASGRCSLVQSNGLLLRPTIPQISASWRSVMNQGMHSSWKAHPWELMSLRRLSMSGRRSRWSMGRP